MPPVAASTPSSAGSIGATGSREVGDVAEQVGERQAVEAEIGEAVELRDRGRRRDRRAAAGGSGGSTYSRRTMR